MKFPAYPKYKSSGVEWLGDVPAHWDVKRLRRIIIGSLQYGANESAELDDPDLPRYVRITDVHENGTLRDETFRSLPKDIAAPYLLEDGDLLFARSGATSGKTFLYQRSWGICAYAGYLIRARMNRQRAVPSFVKYFTTSTSYWEWLSSIFIQSTIQNVSAEKYSDLELSLPPIIEQRSIAEFLDRETGRIDRLVAKKRELIERLKEKRTALISRTVTRGLPPAAAKAVGIGPHPKLKSSGVEWLGEVPEHWDLPPLYCRYTVELGKMLNEDRITGDCLVPYLRNIDVQWDRINTIDLPEMDIAPSEYARYTVSYNDLLVCEGGESGRAAIWQEKDGVWGFQKAIHRLRPRHDESPRFLFYVLFHCANLGVFVSEGNPNTIPHLTGEKLRRYRFPKPRLAEQTAIAGYLDCETGKIDQMVGKVETAIERLQEYRTALITAAVTGKIDVRENRYL